MALTFVIVKALVPSAGSLWAIRIHWTLLGSILSLCSLGQRCRTMPSRCPGHPSRVFFLRNSVSALSNQPFAVDLFTKYSTHRMDIRSDQTWVDDTGLHVWILCFRIGGLGVHMDSYEAEELHHRFTSVCNGSVHVHRWRPRCRKSPCKKIREKKDMERPSTRPTHSAAFDGLRPQMWPTIYI